MKLSNVILSAMVLVGSSAFAARSEVPVKSNSECAHSKKSDSWTQTASTNTVDTVFGSTAKAPAKPQEKATILK